MLRRAVTVKKTYNLPPALVARARRALGVRTETEAVVLALRAIADDEAITSSVRSAGGRLPRFKPLR